MDMKSVLWAITLFAITIISAIPTLAQETKQELAVTDNAHKVFPGSPKINLDQVITRALNYSPVLNAAIHRVDAAIANHVQTGALPNPDFSIEVENIYGDGSYSGMGNAEITYTISQLVELSGKRSNRIQIAEAEKLQIHYMRDSQQLDLIRDVTIAYAELIAAKHDLSVIKEECALAEKIHDSVVARVNAGKEPLIQQRKSQTVLSTSAIALDRANRTVDTKKQALGALMGGNITLSNIDIEDLPKPVEPEDISYYKEKLAQTPDIKLFEANIEQAQSILYLEKSTAIPDPTLSFGMRQFRENDRQAFMAGISFPIPVFDTNRAGIERAAHEFNAAKSERRSGQLSLETALIEAYENYVNAYREANTLEGDILPNAEEVFSFARQGYDAGKFGYFEVLDAQRSLFNARRQFNEAVLEYRQQRAIVERIAAIHTYNFPDKQD